MCNMTIIILEVNTMAITLDKEMQLFAHKNQQIVYTQCEKYGIPIAIRRITNRLLSKEMGRMVQSLPVPHALKVPLMLFSSSVMPNIVSETVLQGINHIPSITSDFKKLPQAQDAAIDMLYLNDGF